MNPKNLTAEKLGGNEDEPRKRLLGRVARLQAVLVLALFVTILTALYPSSSPALTPAGPYSLNTDHATDGYLDWFARSEMSGSTVVVSWGRAGGPPVTTVARSTDYGATWSAPSQLGVSPSGGADIATDGSGTWVAVWPGQNNNSFYSRSIDNGQTWSTPVDLDPSVVVGIDRARVEATQDAWLMVWGQDSSPLRYMTSSDAINWSAPADVTGSGDQLFTLEMDDSGTTIVGLRDGRISRSTDFGSTWATTATSVLEEGGVLTGGPPEVAGDGSGTWLVVRSSDYYPGLGSDGDIVLTRSTDDGVTWSTPTALNYDAAVDTSNSTDWLPDVAYGGGAWLVGWSAGGKPPATMVTSDGDLLVARSIDGGVSWNSYGLLSGYGANDAATDDQLQFATDGLGRWISTWTSPGVPNLGDLDILYTDCALMSPDVEGDGTPNSCDNCPATSNFNQLDSDGDAIGNLCEGDADGDTFVGDVDNCPQVVNSGQDDSDGDGLGDACDPCPGSCPDGDGDGIPDNFDICPNAFDPFQTNSDTDPLGDRCDAYCPGFATSWTVPAGDTDCDGHPDTATAGTRGREDFIGTDLTDRCADTTTLNDEQGPAVGEPLSPWPPDINDNRATNLSDVVGFGPTFNKSGPNPPYNARFDLNAAPQPNGAVNLSDIVVIGSFFNRSCIP